MMSLRILSFQSMYALNLLKMVRKLDNYCNNSSLDFHTWIMSTAMTGLHCLQQT